MTLVAAWVRKIKNCEELIFISDSRLCGGHRWDQCPKLMTFSREDCALAFAGNTDYAYPMMMQLYNSLSEFLHIKTRAMDITDLNGHMLKQINELIRSVYSRVDKTDQDDNEFLFGGYSWVEKCFKIWRYAYSKHDSAFFNTSKEKRILASVSGNIQVIGDQREAFKKELREFLRKKYGDKIESDSISLDMEPFETLCRILIKSTEKDTIGGAPQMIKVYQYMNSRPVGVYWPKKTDNAFSNRTLLGRKMFDYEDTEYWFIDPDTLFSNPCNK